MELMAWEIDSKEIHFLKEAEKKNFLICWLLKYTFNVEALSFTMEVACEGQLAHENRLRNTPSLSK